MCAPLGREKALQNGAFAHKPLHPSKALTEPARLLLHNPATHTGLLSAQREATELPQTTIIPRNHLEMHLVALSAPRLEPDPPFLLHPAQSSFLYPCLSNTKKNHFQKNQLVLKTKHSSPSLRATEPQHEDSLQLKQAESPVHASSPVPATSRSSPWLSPSPAIPKSPGRKRIC